MPLRFFTFLSLFLSFSCALQAQQGDSDPAQRLIESPQNCPSCVEEVLAYWRKLDSLQLEEQAFALIERVYYRASKAKLYLGLSGIYQQDGKFLQAIECAETAELLLQGSYEEGLMADVYDRLCNLYYLAKKYQKSLDNCLKSNKIYEKTGTDEKLCEQWSFIGGIHYRMQNYALALESFEQAYLFGERSGKKELLKLQLNNMALVYKAQQDLDKAEEYFERALQMAEEESDSASIGFMSGNLAAVYAQKGRLRQAVPLLERDIRLSLRYREQESAINAMYSLAKVLLGLEERRKATLYLDSAIVLANKIQYLSGLQRAFEVYADYYVLEKDYTRAYQYLSQARDIQNKLIDQETQNQMTEIQLLYEFERQKSKIDTLEATSRQQAENIEQQQRITFLGAIVLLLSLGLVVSLAAAYFFIRKNHRHLQKANTTLLHTQEQLSRLNENLEKEVQVRTQRLQEANKELDTLLYHASHELRSPISSILGLVEVALMSHKEDESKSLFQKIAATAKHFTRMLRKLRYISEINNDQSTAAFFTLQDLTRKILDKHAESIQARNIQVMQYIEEENLWLSPVLLEGLLENLIENAICYSQNEQAIIEIGLRRKAGALVLWVKDNGIGIAPEAQPHVFDLFYKATEQSKGSGLYIVRLIAQKLNAEIRLESQLGEGSLFQIRLP